MTNRSHFAHIHETTRDCPSSLQSETKNQPKEVVFGRTSPRASGQKLRSGPPKSVWARKNCGDVHENFGQLLRFTPLTKTPFGKPRESHPDHGRVFHDWSDPIKIKHFRRQAYSNRKYTCFWQRSLARRLKSDKKWTFGLPKWLKSDFWRSRSHCLVTFDQRTQVPHPLLWGKTETNN